MDYYNNVLFCNNTGSKFWHTTKVIHAISESDFTKLEMHRNGLPGPSGTRSPVTSASGTCSPIIHVVTDSDVSVSNLLRYQSRRGRITMYHHHLNCLIPIQI